MIEAAGTKPKLIEEFVGGPSTGTTTVSVARMRSPSGWKEPGQRPDFQEITVVLKGSLRVAFNGGHLDVAAGQAVITAPGEWVPPRRSARPQSPRRVTRRRLRGVLSSVHRGHRTMSATERASSAPRARLNALSARRPCRSR